MLPPRDTRAESHGAEAFCSSCGASFPIGTRVCPIDGTQLIGLDEEHDPLLGKLLDGRFEIRARLGEGGMGTVYRGFQLSVEREVAIKVIHPALAGDRVVVKRFLREARLASRLNQSNIVNIHDFGQSDGVLYLAMEMLVGQSLDTAIARSQGLPLSRAITIAMQLCDALEVAHAQSIIHRDLKPGNIVILDEPAGRDSVKVLDFGLAKSLAHPSQSRVTSPDIILGTPLYMAPEQIQGKDSDARTDLYALGCILYELVSGAPPFSDDAVPMVLYRQLHDEPAALPSHLPLRLRTVIERLLAKHPDDRVQTAGAVRAELDLVVRELYRAGASMSAARPTVANSQALGITQAAPARSVAKTSPRRRFAIASIAVALLVVATLVTVQLRRMSRSPGEATRQLVLDAPPDIAASPPDLAGAPDAGVDSTSVMTGSDASNLVPADARRRPPSDARARRPHPPTDAELNFYISD
jgi:Protein kinase domain